ncbi:MAG: hypothetical protein AAF804_18950 [Bacteroidota bacterium]
MEEAVQLRIDQYLSGEMTEVERAAFELELGQSAGLRKELALQQEILSAFQEPEVEDLEQKLQALMSASHAVAPVKPLSSWRTFAVAASVILAVGVGYLLWRNLQAPPTPEELYLAYAKLPPDLQVPSANRTGPLAGDPQAMTGIWLEVDSLYQLKEYGPAEDKLQTWLVQHPDIPTVQQPSYHYFLGMLRLQQRDFKAALSQLEQVEVGPYAENAHWYRTLVRLRLEGITEEVRAELQVFVGYENPYRGVAQELLGQDRQEQRK